MTSETMFAQSPSISFKWKIGCHVRFLKIAIKAMSDPKKISPLIKKVLEVPTNLEINFITIEVGLYFSFHPEKTSLYHSLMGEI